MTGIQVIIADLRGAQLAAAVAKSMGQEVRIGRNKPELSSIHFCQRLIVGCEGPKIWVPDKWELFSVRWSEFGHTLDDQWRPITTQLFNWFGPNWRDDVDGAPGQLLEWFARAYVKSKHEEETTIEVPSSVYYKEWETK